MGILQSGILLVRLSLLALLLSYLLFQLAVASMLRRGRRRRTILGRWGYNCLLAGVCFFKEIVRKEQAYLLAVQAQELQRAGHELLEEQLTVEGLLAGTVGKRVAVEEC